MTSKTTTQFIEMWHLWLFFSEYRTVCCLVRVSDNSTSRIDGNQGNRPFTKDTVKGILTNKFYIGYLPDGDHG